MQMMDGGVGEMEERREMPESLVSAAIIHTPFGCMHVQTDLVTRDALLDDCCVDGDDELVEAVTELRFVDGYGGKHFGDGDMRVNIGVSHNSDVCLAEHDGVMSPIMTRLEQMLVQYAAQAGDFNKIPLAPSGTDFMRMVWRTTCEVVCGHTCTYGDIARMMGNPRAVRAVGSALRRNPIALIIPCHRVVPRTGGFGHYNGGAARKEALLMHEGALSHHMPGELTDK